MIRSYLGIYHFTPKVLQNLNFSGYPLTWVSISLHQKHSKISTFQDTLSFWYASRYTKGTQKSQPFRIPSHSGMHLVTPKALKNLNVSGYSLIFVFISLHQKHSKISTFKDTTSLQYPSRYTKNSQKRQLFRIPSYLVMHLVTAKALKNLNFSGYSFIYVFISLHQKHYKILTFQDILSLPYPSHSTESTQKFQLLRIPSDLGIHVVG